MQARSLHLHFRTYEKLRRLRKEAEADGAKRVAKRIDAITLNHDGWSSGEIAELLQAPRSKVSQWLRDYEQFGYEALLEGQRSGRPGQLNRRQEEQLKHILQSGPASRGLPAGVWSAPMVARVISEEFGVDYTARHTRRLLHRFAAPQSRREPRRGPAREQNRWRRYIGLRLKVD